MNTAGEKDRSRKISVKITPMPADTIAEDIISAGWLLSQMDLAAGTRACRYVDGRAVTVGLEAMEFKAPVYIGEEVTLYTEIARQGRTSVAIAVEAWAEARKGGSPHKVTEGLFTFVHIGENGRPRPIGVPRTVDKKEEKPRPKASETKTMEKEPSSGKKQYLSLRTAPFPKDRNVNGDIFGGWLLTHMDLAAALRAARFTGKRAVPVAIDAMTFHRPVSERNEVSFYTEIERAGTTSVTIKVEAWALKQDLRKYEKVTEGSFVYVAIDKNRKPVPIKSGV